MYFGLGGPVFAVPANDVLTVFPPNISPGTQAADVVNMLKTQTAQGAGCPEKPLEAGLLAVSGQSSDPLLEGRVIMVRAQAGTIDEVRGQACPRNAAERREMPEDEGGIARL